MRPTSIRAWRGANEDDGRKRRESATPYGRALWDADKKALFAEVVKSTEIAKMAGVLERTEEEERGNAEALSPLLLGLASTLQQEAAGGSWMV